MYQWYYYSQGSNFELFCVYVCVCVCVCVWVCVYCQESYPFNISILKLLLFCISNGVSRMCFLEGKSVIHLTPCSHSEAVATAIWKRVRQHSNRLLNLWREQYSRFNSACNKGTPSLRVWGKCVESSVTGGSLLLLWWSNGFFLVDAIPNGSLSQNDHNVNYQL